MMGVLRAGQSRINKSVQREKVLPQMPTLVYPALVFLVFCALAVARVENAEMMQKHCRNTVERVESLAKHIENM